MKNALYSLLRPLNSISPPPQETSPSAHQPEQSIHPLCTRGQWRPGAAAAARGANFGLERDNYDVSMACAEDQLLSAA
ncbi:hypothetical protein Scani_33430 [Streptomyces caniferus]|uniref:Uncharacterized protein n=1 Tax=Streptomyces caniferus TaxID=285557 RepID=A0A640SBU5_9ACTN|nr:hypothetical protein Scani_33430 [Streptomyces caniferus]